MDGLSAAASVMGVVQFSGDVIKLLHDYIQTAKYAKDDIEAMVKALTDLEKLLRSTNELPKPLHGDRYGTAQEFKKELEIYKSCLAELHSKLEIISGKGKRKRDRLEDALKWPFEKKEFTETVQKLRDFRSLSKALNLDQMSMLQDQFQMIETDEKIKILEWIYPVPYNMHHKTIQEARTSETGEWLLQSQNFHDWVDGDSSAILRLYGFPGAGKTFLTFNAVDHVQGLLENTSNYGFAYFYFNRNEKSRREPLSVLRSLVRQVSTATQNPGAIRETVQDMYHRMRLKGVELTYDTCREQLLEAVNLYERTTLVLDAGMNATHNRAAE